MTNTGPSLFPGPKAMLDLPNLLPWCWGSKYWRWSWLCDVSPFSFVHYLLPVIWSPQYPRDCSHQVVLSQHSLPLPLSAGLMVVECLVSLGHLSMLRGFYLEHPAPFQANLTSGLSFAFPRRRELLWSVSFGFGQDLSDCYERCSLCCGELWFY